MNRIWSHLSHTRWLNSLPGKHAVPLTGSHNQCWGLAPGQSTEGPGTWETGRRAPAQRGPGPRPWAGAGPFPHPAGVRPGLSGPSATAGRDKVGPRSRGRSASAALPRLLSHTAALRACPGAHSAHLYCLVLCFSAPPRAGTFQRTTPEGKGDRSYLPAPLAAAARSGANGIGGHTRATQPGPRPQTPFPRPRSLPLRPTPPTPRPRPGPLPGGPRWWPTCFMNSRRGAGAPAASASREAGPVSRTLAAPGPPPPPRAPAGRPRRRLMGARAARGTRRSAVSRDGTHGRGADSNGGVVGSDGDGADEAARRQRARGRLGRRRAATRRACAPQPGGRDLAPGS